MKITRLKNAQGKKPTEAELETLNRELRETFERSGYDTDVNFELGKIGKHMKCFTVTERNAVYDSHWSKTVVGWKFTNLPTWEQREDFNHLINDLLDKHGFTAKIKSGPYDIRCHKEGRVDEWYPVDNGGWYPKPEVVEVDSYMLEERKEALKAHAKQKRLERKQAQAEQKRQENFPPLKIVNS